VRAALPPGTTRALGHQTAKWRRLAGLAEALLVKEA
jgi:hypothetical protein